MDKEFEKWYNQAFEKAFHKFFGKAFDKVFSKTVKEAAPQIKAVARKSATLLILKSVVQTPQDPSER